MPSLSSCTTYSQQSGAMIIILYMEFCWLFFSFCWASQLVCPLPWLTSNCPVRTIDGGGDPLLVQGKAVTILSKVLIRDPMHNHILHLLVLSKPCSSIDYGHCCSFWLTKCNLFLLLGQLVSLSSVTLCFTLWRDPVCREPSKQHSFWDGQFCCVSFSF